MIGELQRRLDRISNLAILSFDRRTIENKIIEEGGEFIAAFARYNEDRQDSELIFSAADEAADLLIVLAHACRFVNESAGEDLVSRRVMKKLVRLEERIDKLGGN